VEKDALEWSRLRLGELLGGLAAEEGIARCHLADNLQSLTGEAFVNCRKGKLIPSYELALTMEWTGEADGSPATGLLHLPYLADENADDVASSLEVRVSATTDTPAAAACKAALLQALPRVRAAVQNWCKEMAAGGPGGAGAAPGTAPSTGYSPAAAAKPAAKPTVSPKVQPAEPVDGKATIRLQERFYCRPQDIFEAFTVPARVRAFTQSDCAVSPAPGADFHLFSGNIHGTNVEMDPGRLIVQRWRFRNWPEGVFSTLRIELAEPEHGTTVLSLTQTGVPVADAFGGETVVDTTTSGWSQNFFERIRKVFGFGC
jgi:activator of HSP90 ATPase